MEVFEITGNVTGISRAGVNFLQPSDSYESIENGFINRQVLQSRKGIAKFAPRLTNGTRVLGIYEFVYPDASTTDLLAFDTNTMYKWVGGTFVAVPFAGSMAAYAGFAITQLDGYFSVAPYPTATNGPRLIICGQYITANAAGSRIFFYNGTDIRDFTSVVDNTDYAPFALGATGVLSKAKFCIYMNQRINFIVPTIGAIQRNQGILFSGINNAAGDGSKFNVSSSGLHVLDTQDTINGYGRLGQFMILNAERSQWTLEITQNAFKPWYSRKIPSVLGTDADFSQVAWFDKAYSVGKTGFIATDGRESIRFDNKIPYFTQDDFDQVNFNFTYGGFDRSNQHVLWSFVSSPYYDETIAQSSKTQDKILVYNYVESSFSVYDLRLTVFGQSDTGLNLTWDEIWYDDPLALDRPDWDTWDTTEDIWDKIGIGQSTQKSLAGDDLGFIYELNSDNDDYFTTISSIVTGATTTINIAASAFKTGDQVVIQSVDGMLSPTGDSINNFDPEEGYQVFTPYTIISATPTQVIIHQNTTLYTAATPNTGSISKVINFSAKTIPFNPWRDKGLRCYVSFIEILINTNGGFILIDLFEDEEDDPYRFNLLALPDQDSAKDRQWVSISVDHEANFHAFRFKQFTPAVQVEITSVRIHCQPGGYTSG